MTPLEIARHVTSHESKHCDEAHCFQCTMAKALVAIGDARESYLRNSAPDRLLDFSDATDRALDGK